MVEEILKDATTITRTLIRKPTRRDSPECYKIRWVTLAKSCSEQDIEHFVKKLNNALINKKVQFELIKTTAPTIGKLLFNNNNNNNNNDNNATAYSSTCRSTCHVCKHSARGELKKAESKSNKENYHIDQRTSYSDSGIYLKHVNAKNNMWEKQLWDLRNGTNLD